MKNIYKIGIVAGLLTLAGCSNDEWTEQAEGVKSFTTLYATIDDIASTRAYLTDGSSAINKAVAWDEDDYVEVYSDTKPEFTYFRKVSDNGQKALFSGEKVEGNKFYAVYSRETKSIDEENSAIIHTALNNKATNDNDYFFEAPMVAVSTDNNFVFKQTTGLIHIEVGNIPTITELHLYGNNDENIAGDGYIDMSVPNPVFRLYNDGEHWAQSQEWSLFEEDQQVLEQGQTKDFYFIVPPMTFEKGISIRVVGYDAAGVDVNMVKSTKQFLTVERASVHHFTLVDVMATLEEQKKEQAELELNQKILLQSIYASLSNNSGEYPESWTMDNELRNWQYVGVDQDGYVTSLNIYGRQMNGQIPAAIGQLTHLNWLGFQGLGLTGSIPEEIGLLPQLNALFLQSNQLEGTLPASIYEMTSLRELQITGNYFNFTITKQMQQNSVMWQNLENANLNPQRGRYDEATHTWIQNKITVEGTIATITLSANEINVGINGSGRISIDAHEPEEADISQVVWERYTVTDLGDDSTEWSDNDDVISIDQDGVFTVHGFGRAVVQVHATDKGGAWAECYVNVLTDEEIEAQNQLRATLTEFYNATGGPNWNRHNNWATDAPLEQWEGLEFRNGKLRRIELVRNNLKGVIPQSFWNITSLDFVKLESNQLSGAFPADIANLTNLQHLNLCGNQFTGTISEVLGILSNNHELNYLDIQGNPFTGTLTDVINGIGSFSNLEVLNLGHNGLTGTIPATIGNLSQLTKLISLDLYDNQFTGSIPPEIGNLTNLEHLHLGGNRLTGSLPAAIGNLTNLRDLYLAYNSLSGTIPEEIGQLNKLTELNLSNNCLTIPATLPSWLQNLLEGIVSRDGYYDLSDQNTPANASTEGFNGGEEIDW